MFGLDLEEFAVSHNLYFLLEKSPYFGIDNKY